MQNRYFLWESRPPSQRLTASNMVIVKKIDLFPLGICMGLCQGFMPLVGYNYAAKNYKRMRQISVFSWKTALVIALCFVICFFSFAPWIMQAFIQEAQTSTLGASFLRVACLAVPLTAVNALIIYTMQAMGKGIQSTFLTVCRQGLLNVPCLLFMNWFVGLYGMIWTQLIIEALMLPVTIGIYAVTWKSWKSQKSKLCQIVKWIQKQGSFCPAITTYRSLYDVWRHKHWRLKLFS